VSIAPRKISQWWWAAGGCAALLVLTIATGVVVSILVWNSRLSCLPSDFPIYPGATFSGQTYDSKAKATPGNSCLRTYRTNDSPDTVLDVYAAKLNTGHWEIVRNFPPTQGQIDFRDATNHRKHGSVTVLTFGGATEIMVAYYSP
jgi:hypothetical protein